MPNDPEAVEAIWAQANRAAVSIEPVPLLVAQNMARAVLNVLTLHRPDAWSYDRVRCRGCEQLMPCETLVAIGRVLE